MVVDVRCTPGLSLDWCQAQSTRKACIYWTGRHKVDLQSHAFLPCKWPCYFYHIHSWCGQRLEVPSLFARHCHQWRHKHQHNCWQSFELGVIACNSPRLHWVSTLHLPIPKPFPQLKEVMHLFKTIWIHWQQCLPQGQLSHHVKAPIIDMLAHGDHRLQCCNICWVHAILLATYPKLQNQDHTMSQDPAKGIHQTAWWSLDLGSIVCLRRYAPRNPEWPMPASIQPTDGKSLCFKLTFLPKDLALLFATWQMMTPLSWPCINACRAARLLSWQKIWPPCFTLLRLVAIAPGIMKSASTHIQERHF